MDACGDRCHTHSMEAHNECCQRPVPILSFALVDPAGALCPRRAVSGGTLTSSKPLTGRCSAHWQRGRHSSESSTGQLLSMLATADSHSMLAIAPQPLRCGRARSQTAAAPMQRHCRPQLRCRLAVRAADGDGPQQQQGTEENGDPAADAVGEGKADEASPPAEGQQPSRRTVVAQGAVAAAAAIGAQYLWLRSNAHPGFPPPQ